MKFLTVFLFLISLSYSYAQAGQLGCCTNPGAGILSCSSDKLVALNQECCPQPESSFPSYYRSGQNQGNPLNYAECSSGFFYPGQGCSGIGACSVGCCCSELGGSVSPESQCKGTGLIFYKGQTNCNQLCATPQCNDGTDNDNNGCADFNGGDSGCTGAADSTESGGTCLRQGPDCNNPNYEPILSNFEVAAATSQKKFLLSWEDGCKGNSLYYEVYRCEGSGCTNFDLVSTLNGNSFEDTSETLQFGKTYTFKVKAYYTLQSSTPFVLKAGSLGSLECLNQPTSNVLCLNNSAYYCNALNNLVPQGTKCSQSEICIVTNNKPSCFLKSKCEEKKGNPLGLYYTKDGCEKNKWLATDTETYKYCFYDKSRTVVDYCFNCNPSMACYDYKSQQACTRDNCRVGSCIWKNIGNDFDAGVCISTQENNCKWCTEKGTPSIENKMVFNSIFDACTLEKSGALSYGVFKCYFNNGIVNSCQDTICKNYAASQCSNQNIQHDENNNFANPSNDECGIKACQNIGNQCVKNADGDNTPDCTDDLCEKDYFPPNTTLIPTIKQGVINSFNINIYDKLSSNSSARLRTSSNYVTYLCLEPCGLQGHPYDKFTTSRKLILSGLSIFNGDSGNKILSLQEGNNVVRYYSQDPAKNIEAVKRITIEAHRDTANPYVYGINVTDASKINEKFITRNTKPVITALFIDPAIITFARVVNKHTGLSVRIDTSSELKKVLILNLNQNLPEGEYTFEMNAKNQNNLFMSSLYTATIIIDTTDPALNIITPTTGAIINLAPLSLLLAFSEEVVLNSVKINLVDVTNSLLTTDKKSFTGSLNLSDGNKVLEISAKDYAGNQISGKSTFTVDAYSTQISLSQPRFGVSPNYNFDIAVQTDNNAQCKYELDNNLEFNFMSIFQLTGGVIHSISNFNGIASGDVSVHKLYVKCQDSRGTSSGVFDLSVDASPPQIINSFAYPNPVIERPIKTTLTVQTNEPAVCKYSANTKDFNSMENKFDGFDNSTFLTVNRQQINSDNEGAYDYYVACENKAQTISPISQINIKADLTIPLNIISHTPLYFNLSTIVLAVETNKLAQCKYSETDPTVQTGFVFGAPSYGHTAQLTLTDGKHDFYVACKDQYLQQWSSPLKVSFVADTSPPIMLSVDDTSTLAFASDKTCSTDQLRVKFLGEDPESGIKNYSYSIIKDNQPVTQLTDTLNNNEWIWVQNLSLQDKSLYFFSIKARNYAELDSLPKISDGITVDTSVCNSNVTSNSTCKDASACKLNDPCTDNSDCESRFCSGGSCNQATCSDGAKNQDESDIDCGGSCIKCTDSKLCRSNNDCQTGSCNFGTCGIQETCLDEKLSPGESDIDCGGQCPKKCAEGSICEGDSDCLAGLKCSSSQCKKSTSAEMQQTGVTDSDGDGMTDNWEAQNGLNPNDPNDANSDEDKDGLTNLQEFKLKETYGNSTDPHKADSDRDGYGDGDEANAGTNPLDAKDFPKSSKTKIILFIVGAVVLISGFGYLAYTAVQKRKENEFEIPKQTEISRVSQIPRPVQPVFKPRPNYGTDQARINEALKAKRQRMDKERKNLFASFGNEKTEIQKPQQTAEKIQKPVNKTQNDQKTKYQPNQAKPRKTPVTQIKKHEEDVFARLREITKEPKNKRTVKNKNASSK